MTRLFRFAIETVVTVTLPEHTATCPEYPSRMRLMNKTKGQPSGFGWIALLVFFAFLLVVGFWWAVFQKIVYVNMNDLGVLFSGLAFAAVFSALLVQWWQFRSTQAQVMETQDQLGMQTLAMQGQMLAMQGQALQPVVEAKVSELEDALEALELKGGTSDLRGHDLLEWVVEDPDSGGSTGRSLKGVERFASARSELEDLGKLLEALRELPVGEAPRDIIEPLRSRVQNTLEAIPPLPQQWNPSTRSQGPSNE